MVPPRCHRTAAVPDSRAQGQTYDRENSMRLHLGTRPLGLIGSVIVLGSVASGTATAQQRPADKPPIAQGWIDIATFAAPGMPSGMAGMMGGMAGGGGGMVSTPLSALMGGKPQGNTFGLTQS